MIAELTHEKMSVHSRLQHEIALNRSKAQSVVIPSCVPRNTGLERCGYELDKRKDWQVVLGKKQTRQFE